MTSRTLPIVEPTLANDPPDGSTAKWLELTLDYRCNLRCVGCRACVGGDDAMSRHDMARWIAWGRRQGISGLWIGGGEPTLRDELPALVQSARRAGYTSVLVQTNALRVAYAAYASVLVKAGLTHARVNVKSFDAAVHDEMSGVEGALDLAMRGIDQLVSQGVDVAADVLLTKRTHEALAATLEALASRGVRSVMLWLLSAHDSDDPLVLGEIPSFTSLVPSLERALVVARDRGLTLESLHTPACVLPEGLRSIVTPAVTLRLLVANPGNSRRPAGDIFHLEDSPIEGGAFLASCDACSERGRCSGPRADYVALYGASEFQPISIAPHGRSRSDDQ